VDRLRWVLAAAVSAYACHLAVHHTTPIDRALPLLGVLATVLAAVTYPAVMLAVPVLILAEIAVPAEEVRLLAFGVIFAIGLIGPIGPIGRIGRIGLAIVLVVLLRWIPLDSVLWGRELFLLAIAVLIVLVLGSTRFAVAVAVITALITPAVPLRTLALPLVVLFVCVAARVFGMPKIELRWVSSIALAFVTLFFAWSGIVARAFPYFWRRAARPMPRVEIAQALPPRADVTFEVPPNAHALIVSGANVARLRRGTPLARVGDAVVRIGDAADWGYMRREQFYASRNPLPRDAAGQIRGYGYAAWVDGAGRIALPAGARSVRVVVDASLPAGAALQVEGFEIAPR